MRKTVLDLGSTSILTSIGLFYKKVWRLWRVSDCEELVGVTYRRWWWNKKEGGRKWWV